MNNRVKMFLNGCSMAFWISRKFDRLVHSLIFRSNHYNIIASIVLVVIIKYYCSDHWSHWSNFSLKKKRNGKKTNHGTWYFWRKVSFVVSEEKRVVHWVQIDVSTGYDLHTFIYGMGFFAGDVYSKCHFIEIGMRRDVEGDTPGFYLLLQTPNETFVRILRERHPSGVGVLHVQLK